jgi:hypothetical protein
VTVEFRRVTDLSIWFAIEEKIAEACSRGSDMTAGGVHLDLLQCRKQLWIGASEENGIEVICLTEIRQFAKDTALVLVLCIGEGRHRWLDHVEDLKTYAREQGCTRIKAFSRPGWRRDLTKRGFVHTHDIMEMSLA